MHLPIRQTHILFLFIFGVIEIKPRGAVHLSYIPISFYFETVLLSLALNLIVLPQLNSWDYGCAPLGPATLSYFLIETVYWILANPRGVQATHLP